MANFFTVQSVFGFGSVLGKVSWQQEITDEVLRSAGVPVNAAFVDLIVTVSDPTSLSDINMFGVGYENAGIAVNGPGEYRDGETYAIRGIPVRKGDNLFIAGNSFASPIQVSIERQGTALPPKEKEKSAGEAFGEQAGKSIGTGVIILIGLLLLASSVKKALP